MKKNSILKHILLPYAVILIIIPILSSFIFYSFAIDYAYKQASSELKSLNKNIVASMERNLKTKDDYLKEVDIKKYNNPDDDPYHQFLIQSSLIASGNSGNASLIILSGKNTVIFPKDPSERLKVQDLANDFINSSIMDKPDNIMEIRASNGKKYLATFHKPIQKSIRFGGFMIYCPTEIIANWVFEASALIFIISTILAVLLFISLYLATKSITNPLKKLCSESERIGSGDFKKIDTEFSLNELETLRISMNKMSEQLEHSDRSQKLFFQSVSHELRNPLMSISGYAQGIEQDVFPDNKAAAHTILSESTRLTDIVSSLLTLSRLESHEILPSFKEISFNDTIENCIDRFYGFAIQNEISLSFDDHNCNIYGLCDDELLQKIIDNLLSNAIRYANSEVLISLEKKSDTVSISVSDDGSGISEKDFSHIFDRCYKGIGGNYGIGLAIVESASKLINASISVHNLENSGACFTITIKA